MELNALQNTRCSIQYSPVRKFITAYDLRDTNNLPYVMSKSKRGLKSAWAEINFRFNEATTLHDIGVIFDAHKIKYHCGCMMD